MKLFFDQRYYCCGALLVLLAAGCTTSPVATEQETAVAPSLAETTMAPPIAEAPPVVESIPPCDIASLRLEEAQLQKQLDELTGVQKLLDDMARYPSLSGEETRRTLADLNSKITAVGAVGSGDRNRVRLAFLLSLQPAGANDQRALSLLDSVIKNEKVAVPLRHLASILRVEIQEKQRAIQKLDALRDVDRRLLNERMPGGKKPQAKAITKHP